MKDLKEVYKAVNETMTSQALQSLEDKWGDKYPIVIQSWQNNWENLSTYFDFPQEIRKIIYTTNALEGFNRQLRKFTKVRTVFPTDESLLNFVPSFYFTQIYERPLNIKVHW